MDVKIILAVQWEIISPPLICLLSRFLLSVQFQAVLGCQLQPAAWAGSESWLGPAAKNSHHSCFTSSSAGSQLPAPTSRRSLGSVSVWLPLPMEPWGTNRQLLPCWAKCYKVPEHLNAAWGGRAGWVSPCSYVLWGDPGPSAECLYPRVAPLSSAQPSLPTCRHWQLQTLQA